MKLSADTEHRMQAQFEHLAEMYFNGFDHDLGERELGYVLSLDTELDVFASSIALTKTALEAIVKDDGLCPVVTCFHMLLIVR